jgi:hypothetical protein
MITALINLQTTATGGYSFEQLSAFGGGFLRSRTMKLYTVDMGLAEARTLRDDAGMPVPCARFPKYGWHTGDLQPYETERNEVHCRVYVRFRRKRDAVDFAIWAMGWIAARWSNGKVPCVALDN